jgi:diguanylate cyclase (GGDEF)-like protein
MKGRIKVSLGGKIALAIGLPLLLAALVGIGVSWRKADEVVRENAAEEAASLADLVATSFALAGDLGAEPAPGTAHRQVDAAMKAEFRVLGSVGQLRIIDRDGVVRWSRRPEEMGTRLADAQRLLAAPEEGSMDAARGEYVRPLAGPSCARCHGSEPRRLGAVQLVLSQPRQSEAVSLFFRATLSFVALLAAGFTIASGLALRSMVLRPIDRLVESMQRAEKGDFLVRAPAGTDDEIGQLGNAFNSMVARITELKVAEIETSREMESMQRELELKEELERQHQKVEEANRALARRVREVTLLLDVARSLNSSLELPEILNLVTEMVGVTVGVEQFAVMLLEGEEQLTIAASFGMAQERVSEFKLPLGHGASGIAAQTREPVYIADLQNDPRYVKGPQDPTCDASLLCVPMICKERLVGVLNFVRHKKAAFNENDIVLLQLVGSQAAMAILNAQLFTETRQLSLVDSLTGCFNRRHLFERLKDELARAQRFESSLSVVMIDIDHFKELNDTHGHSVGDQVLKQVAALLRGAVRQVDTVARYGGEEFMVVLPKCERAEANEVAETLRRLVEQSTFPCAHTQPLGRLTISLGIAAWPRDGGTLEQLVDGADAALYASKRGGRNLASLFEPGMELHPGRERGPQVEERRALAAGTKLS